VSGDDRIHVVDGPCGRVPELPKGCFGDAKHQTAGVEPRAALEETDRLERVDSTVYWHRRKQPPCEATTRGDPIAGREA